MHRIVPAAVSGTCSFTALSALAVALATVPLAPGTAAAQNAQAPRTARIAIPAQPLGAALERIQAETGTTVTYDPDLVRGLQSKAVRKARSARDAVVGAIAGLPLALRIADNGSLMVFGVSAAAPGDVVVIGRRDEAETNYNVNKATSSTRTGQTLKDIPQSTAVISDKLIRDQQAQSVLDAMRNAGGVVPVLGVGGGPPGFLVRGYSANPLSNGLSSPAAVAAPVAAVERVEVIRGPVAILAGAESFGGTVNIVPKKPVATPLLNVALEYQSYDDKKVTVDASNAITADRALSARVIGQWEEAKRAPGGYKGRHERFLAPSLRYKNASADITVGLNTSETFTPREQATIYDNITKRPRTDVISPLGPREQGGSIDSTRYYVDATVTPAPWLTLVARGEHYDVSQTFRYQFLYGTPTAAGDVLLQDTYSRQSDKGEALDTYARLKFSTGPLHHTVIGGVNYSNITTMSRSAEPQFPTVNIFRKPTIDFGTLPLQALDDAILKSRTTSYYVQELVETGPLHVLGSLRHAKYKSSQVSPLYGGPGSKEDKASTLPSVGAVVDVTSNLSLYGNYLKGYRPVVQLDCSGNAVPDFLSRNVEGGVKADLMGKRMSLVGSVFDIRTNVRYDYSPRAGCLPGRPTVVPGGQVNRGVELTATGNLLPGLNINASYSYQKITYRNPLLDPAFPEFSQVIVPGVSRNSYSLFAAYERPTKGRLTFGGAFGLYGTSKSYIDGGATKPIPGGSQVDTSAYVNFGTTRLIVGVRNVLDKTLYSPTTVDFYVPVREGRRVIVTLSHAFF